MDDAKLLSYCLNPDHPRGKHKARMFASLGLTKANAPILKAALLDAVETGPAEAVGSDAFGSRYLLDFDLETTKMKVRVRSIWIVRAGEDFPRLVSC